MSIEPWIDSAIPIVVRFGLQVLGALVVAWRQDTGARNPA